MTDFSTQGMPDGRLKLFIPEQLELPSNWVPLLDPHEKICQMGCEIVSLPTDERPQMEIIAPVDWTFSEETNFVRDAAGQNRMYFRPSVSFFGMGAPAATILHTRFQVEFYCEVFPNYAANQNQVELNFIRLADNCTLSRDYMFCAFKACILAPRFRDFAHALLDNLKHLHLGDPAKFWNQDVGRIFEDAGNILKRQIVSDLPDVPMNVTGFGGKSFLRLNDQTY